MEKDGDESLNTLVGRNLYIERMMNSQMIGSYLAVIFFSAGVIYGNTSTGLLLLPSIGVFLLFANVIFWVKNKFSASSSRENWKDSRKGTQA
ncbi:hypothetical protein AAULR_00275 [Lacticaseibacillus rhamnosus MTCC 5462]|nr:hypothetical protein AAULR_00275 [Lacticaseibacillus rhamnosus MTCC 5462]